MVKWIFRLVVMLAALAALAAGGCWYLFLKPTSIAYLQENADRYDGKEVLVYGKVISSFDIMGMGGYKVAEKTGEIYIVTSKGAPQEGRWVTVRGSLHKTMNIGKKGVVAIRETEKYDGRYFGF